MSEMFATLDRDKMIDNFGNLRENYLLDLRHHLVERARKHLHRGFLIRVNMLEESVLTLDGKLRNANGPLSSYLATQLTLLLNAYYLNLAGSLDNLAWALVYHHELEININEDDPKQRKFAQLLDKNFLQKIKQRGLTSLHSKIQEFRDWYWDMREFRDPAAHRIPVLVPGAIYTEKDIVEMNRLEAEAAELFAKGNRTEGMKTFRQIYQLGEQRPVFVSETSSLRRYDLAKKLNLDRAQWYCLVSTVISEGFSSINGESPSR